MTTEEIEGIKGKGSPWGSPGSSWIQVWVRGWFYSWYEWVYGRHWIVIPPHGITHADRITFIERRGWYRRWGWRRRVHGWHRICRLVQTPPWNWDRHFTPPCPRRYY